MPRSYVDKPSPLFRWSGLIEESEPVNTEYESGTFAQNPSAIEMDNDDVSSKQISARHHRLSFVAETNLPTEHGMYAWELEWG